MCFNMQMADLKLWDDFSWRSKHRLVVSLIEVCRQGFEKISKSCSRWHERTGTEISRAPHFVANFTDSAFLYGLRFHQEQSETFYLSIGWELPWNSSVIAKILLKWSIRFPYVQI
jgi:hypothetical protein